MIGERDTGRERQAGAPTRTRPMFCRAYMRIPYPVTLPSGSLSYIHFNASPQTRSMVFTPSRDHSTVTSYESIWHENHTSHDMNKENRTVNDRIQSKCLPPLAEI